MARWAEGKPQLLPLGLPVGCRLSIRPDSGGNARCGQWEGLQTYDYLTRSWILQKIAKSAEGWQLLH